MSITPMRQTFTHKKRTGSGLYGPTYTDYPSQPCRFSQETAVVKKPNSQEVVSNAVIRTSVAVVSDDFVIYGSVTYPVLSVRSITGIGGQIIEYEIRL
jgi:hypothetical protein